MPDTWRELPARGTHGQDGHATWMAVPHRAVLCEMQNDLKIGLAVGLGLVTAAALWLATRPSLTPQARMQNLYDAGGVEEPVVQPTAPVISGHPQRQSDAAQRRDSPTSSAQTSQDRAAPTRAHETDNVPGSPADEQLQRIKTETFYIVRKGDTLSAISYKYYGSASKWPKIFNANRKTLSDANKLTPGTKLIIPN